LTFDNLLYIERRRLIMRDLLFDDKQAAEYIAKSINDIIM